MGWKHEAVYLRGSAKIGASSTTTVWYFLTLKFDFPICLVCLYRGK